MDGDRGRLPADQWAFFVGFLILLPFYLAPLLVTRFLPGQDLPHHLALVDLLLRTTDESAGLGPYKGIYHAELRVAPDVLYYALMTALGQTIPVGEAHKLIAALSVTALPLAAARLLGACQRSRLPALLVFPLAYGMGFFHGQVLFLLSLPVLLLLLSQVADNLDDEREMQDTVGAALGRDGLLVLLAVVLFASSLETYLFGLCAAAAFIVLSDAPMVYRVRTGLCLLPSLVALSWWRAVTVHEGDPAPAIGRALGMVFSGRLLQRSGEELLRDMGARLEDLPRHVLLPLSDALPGLTYPVWMALLGTLTFYIAVGTLSVFVRGGNRNLARLVVPGLGVLLLALCAYLLLPESIPGLDLRFFAPRFATIAAAVMGLLVPAWIKRLPRWAMGFLLLPALLTAGFYGVGVTRQFYNYGVELEGFAKVLDQVPPGGRAMGLVYEIHSKALGLPDLNGALPHYYLSERRSKDSLMSLPLCGARRGLCEVKDAGLVPPDPGAPAHLNLSRAVPYFDYFITCGAPPGVFGPYASALVPLAHAGPWAAYQRKAPAPAEAQPAPKQKDLKDQKDPDKDEKRRRLRKR